MKQSSSDVFVGRRSEMDLLAAALEEARSKRPQIISIEGEPGIGKSALMRRFLAGAEDVVVLRASGDEGEVDLDYGVVAQLSSTGAQMPGPPIMPAKNARFDSPLSVGAELLRVLDAVQDDATVVLVVDDLHWVDLSSARALHFTLRRLHGDRVLVLLASRGDSLDRLGDGWSRLLADPDRVSRMPLFGLNGSDIQLLASFLRAESMSCPASPC